MNRIGLSLLLLSSLAMSGCWFGIGRKKPKAPPAPRPPIVSPTPDTKREDKPVPPIETPPELKPQGIPSAAPPVLTEEKPASKPPAKKSHRRSPAPAPPAATPAAPPSTPAATAPAPQPVPQLGVLLTAEQRNQYENEYGRDLALAQDGLVRASRFSLSGAQKENVSRIHSFMRQAEELHTRDLATAAQLARRAAVLAQDLAESLR